MGYALYKVFGPTLKQITELWVHDKRVQSAILNGSLTKFLPFFVYSSRVSKVSTVTEDPHQVLGPCFGNNLRYWFFDFPIYALPVPLARAWLLLVRIVNQVDSLLTAG